MKCLRTIVTILSAALAVGLVAAERASSPDDLTGDYLGQAPPGAVPQVFAPGIVSADANEHSAPAFSPDGNEVFWWANRPPESEGEDWTFMSMTMRRENGRWSAPRASPFGEMVALSPDGRRAYFGQQSDLWVAEKQGEGWGEARCLGFLKRFPELQNVFMPSIARNGNLYFVGRAPGAASGFNIYRSELVDGEYAKPLPLPPSINLPGFMSWTPFIAPDESYLLFASNRRDAEHDAGDIYITRRQPDGRWSDPASLGEPVNSPRQEGFPGLSPDGKYLFFCRDTPDRHNDVYWIEAAAVPVLSLAIAGPPS